MPLQLCSLIFGASGFVLVESCRNCMDLQKDLKPCLLPAQDQDMLWKAKSAPQVLRGSPCWGHRAAVKDKDSKSTTASGMWNYSSLSFLICKWRLVCRLRTPVCRGPRGWHISNAGQM